MSVEEQQPCVSERRSANLYGLWPGIVPATVQRQFAMRYNIARCVIRDKKPLGNLSLSLLQNPRLIHGQQICRSRRAMSYGICDIHELWENGALRRRV